MIKCTGIKKKTGQEASKGIEKEIELQESEVELSVEGEARRAWLQDAANLHKFGGRFVADAIRAPRGW